MRSPSVRFCFEILVCCLIGFAFGILLASSF